VFAQVKAVNIRSMHPPQRANVKRMSNGSFEKRLSDVLELGAL